MRSLEAAQDLMREWEGRGTKAVLVSVKDAIARFLEDAAARHLSDATIGKQKVLLAQLLAFADDEGVKYVSQIGAEDLLKFRGQWTDSPISATKKLERLPSFFRFCHGMKWVEENPAAVLKPPKFVQRPTLPFTEEEWQRFLPPSTDIRSGTPSATTTGPACARSCCCCDFPASVFATRCACSASG
jgi:site-specific recombinase XerD